MATKLTKKRRDFCKEVAKDGNASRSAELVYDTKNNASARAIGSQLLKEPRIQEEITDIIDSQEGGTDKAITARLIKRAKSQKDVSNANRADETLLKLKGKFKEQRGLDMNDFLNKLKK